MASGSPLRRPSLGVDVSPSGCVLRPQAPLVASVSVADTVEASRGSVSFSAGAQQFIAGRTPLVYQINGAIGVGARGQHVSSCRGVVAIMDPQQTDRIGDYEVQIFPALENGTETADSPLVQVSISPWSHAAEGAGAAVQIAAHGVREAPHFYTLQFNSGVDARAFLRDFHVRCRVMQLSHRLSRLEHGPRRRSGRGPRWLFCRLVATLAFIFVILATRRAVSAPAEPCELALAALTDAGVAAAWLGERVAEVGAAVCSSIDAGRKAVPISQLEGCFALTDLGAKLDCAETLARTRPGLDHERLVGFDELSWPAG